MTFLSRQFRALAGLMLVTLPLAACGGAFAGGGDDDDDDGGTSGSGGQVGAGAQGGSGKGGVGNRGGAGGSASGAGGNGGDGNGGDGNGGDGNGGDGSCEWGGMIYADGDTFPAGDNCNDCTCYDGEVACTAVACAPGCEHDGQHYEVNDTFPAGDGCNTCTCTADGTVGCTDLACTDDCSKQADLYASAIEEARSCNPYGPNQCTVSMPSSLPCGCPVFVNPANMEAMDAAAAAQSAFNLNQCGANALCAPCLPPTSGACSSEGLCYENFEGPDP